VKLLLDTHVFLWWRSNNRRLGRSARAAVAEAGVVFVSAATAWEAAIKAALGRLEYPDTIDAGVSESGFEKLPITLAHAEHAACLPPHHADPFDRMLVAQAELEGLTLVTHDRNLAPYGTPVIWA
jgi:PIN domain nuclease of toxin-antitoxin system